MFTDNDLRNKLGNTGSTKVRSMLSLNKMSAGLSVVYNELLTLK
jgi:hypothetical protein